MRTLALASLLLCSLPAFAGTPLDKYDSKAGSVAVTGVTEVPLYRIRQDDRLLVRVKVSDKREATFLLTLADTSVHLSEDLAKELGLKVKSVNKRLVNLKGEDHRFRQGGEIKQATLGTFELGGLKITDLTVQVSGKLGDLKGYPIEGTLPLSLFPSQLAFAAVPSKGVLRIGPAVEGANLVAAVGGQAIPYTSAPREKFKNKVRGYKVKEITSPYPVMVDATVGGQAVKVELGRAGLDCEVSAALDLKDAPRRKVADQELVWVSTTLAGVEAAPQWYTLSGAYDLQLGPRLPVQGQVCGQVLDGLDLAIDPVGRRLGLAKAGADARQDLEATALQSLATSTEVKPEPPKDDKGKKDAGPPKPSPEPWIALYEAQWSRSDLDGALVSAQKIVEIDPDDCSAQHRLGETQRQSGRFSEAVSSLSKAAELYHAWWDLPLEEREELSKKLKKAKTDEEKAAVGHKEQASSCYTAEGDLAGVYMQMGDLINVQRLYVERLDLDPDVALIAGNAALAEGKAAEANAAYRQAIKREKVGRPNAASRVGLGLSAGDWVAAAPAFEEAAKLSTMDALSGRVWLDGVRKASGQDAALTAARELSNSRPDSVTYAVLYYREAQLSGQAAAIAGAEARVAATSARVYRDTDPGVRSAVLAWYDLLRGDLAAAEAKAGEAVKTVDHDPIAWVVLSEIAASNGQSEKANRYLRNAAQDGAWSPSYALIAGTLR